MPHDLALRRMAPFVRHAAATAADFVGLEFPGFIDKNRWTNEPNLYSPLLMALSNIEDTDALSGYLPIQFGHDQLIEMAQKLQVARK